MAIAERTRSKSPTSPDPHPAPAWLTLDAGGTYLGIHPRTIRRAIARGELTGYMFGKPTASGPGMKGVRVKLAELEAWAESRAMPNARTVHPAGSAAR